MRNEFCAEMIAAFTKKAFVFLTGDLGFKALEPLAAAMGDNFINAGVSEQNMVGVAAGIARTGIPVWVYSIAPFAYARPFEQIRNDVCLHDLPVTIVGNGGGYGYGVMGGTHHAIEDYGAMLTLQNMHAFVPALGPDVGIMIDRIIKLKKPTYFRLGLAEKIEGLEQVQYSQWRKLLHGQLGTIVVTGAIAGTLLKMLITYPENSRPNIWVLGELPLADLPEDFIADIKNSHMLCAVEEHVSQGGIGQMLALKLLETNVIPAKFVNIHANGYVSGFYGSQAFHRNESGLSAEAVIKMLKGK